MGKEEEILTFLVNAWGNLGSLTSHRIAVLFYGNNFSSQVKNRKCILPKFNPKISQSSIDLEGLDRWRVWRYGAFHEAMHHNMTHVNWWLRLRKKAASLLNKRNNVNYYDYSNFDTDLTLRLAFNIIEDYRINELGDREFPGMQEEHVFCNDFFSSAVWKKFKDMGKQTIQTDEDALNAVAFASWRDVDAVKEIIDLTDEEEETVRDLTERLKKIPDKPYSGKEVYPVSVDLYDFATNYQRTQDGAHTLEQWMEENGDMVTDVSKVSSDDMMEFRSKYGTLTIDPDGNITIRRGRKPSDERDEKNGGKQGEKEEEEEGDDREDREDIGGASEEDRNDIDQDIVDEYRLIEANMDKDTRNSADGTISDYIPTGAPGRITGIEVAPPSGNYLALVGDMRTSISRLTSLLQKWKIGWEEVSDEIGDELDIEGVITGSRKQFYDEQRNSPRGTTYVLLDMSSSLNDVQEQYKRTFAAVCEVFNNLGMKFEAAAFSGGWPLQIVKSYNEKWKNEQRSRLAGLYARESTPTAEALDLVFSIIKKHGVKRCFVITDGAPDNQDEARNQIKRMENHGVRVYGIGYAGVSQGYYSSTEDMMKESFDRQFKDKRRYIVISELRQLPKEFFKMVEAEIYE